MGGRSKAYGLKHFQVKHGQQQNPRDAAALRRRSHRFVLCRFDDCHHSGKQFFGILAGVVVRAYENPLVSLNKALLS